MQSQADRRDSTSEALEVAGDLKKMVGHCLSKMQGTLTHKIISKDTASDSSQEDENRRLLGYHQDDLTEDAVRQCP